MSEPTVFIGLDVGKSEHHCTALNTAGKRLADRHLPNDVAALRELFTGLAARRAAARRPRAHLPGRAKKAPRMHAALADRIWTALGEQTVVVAGTAAVDSILPGQAAALAGLLDQRRQIAADVERVLDDHALAQVLTSMPGVGARTAARILVEVGDASSFPTAGHLAAYAGLAPVTRRSGSSIKGEHPARGGNKRLKKALFLSAFAALADPESRAY